MKPTKKTVLEWDYNDLDEFITKEFGAPNGISRSYEVVAYEEWGNYENHSFDVTGDPDESDVEDLIEERKWKKYRTSDILNYLCAQGKLDKGEYLVSVSW